MQNLYTDLKKLLQQHQYGVTPEGKLLKNSIIENALKLDAALIKLLLTVPTLKAHFFETADDILVFDKIKFQRFVMNKQFLPDSYTAYKNKIGLTTDNDDYLTESKEIVLAWPYKDCVLEGGQTKEDDKRNETFWNETLAPDQIDRLLAPKTLTNFKQHTPQGQQTPTKISLNNNLLIKGNNLLVLHSLLPTYQGKVKLIYIDPPYNTGNDGFNYNDSFNHSTWLTFMKNRLEIAKKLLSDDGTIAISIDHNETIYTQSLCDEIFGANNRKNIITVKRSSVSGAKVINPGVVNVSDYLLIYCKNPLSWKPNRVFRKKERDDRYGSFITNFEEHPSKWKFCSVLDAWASLLNIEKSKLKKHFNDNYDNELEKFYYNNAHKIFQFVSLDDNAVSEEVTKLKMKSKEDSSQVFILEREEKLNYYIYQGKGMLFLVNRLTEIDGQKTFAELITDIWDDVLPNDLHNEGGVSLRKGKKPEKFLQRILLLTTNPNDLVLDYHVGSGTTCAVAHKMGRRYIGVEQMDYIETMTVERLKKVIMGEQGGISKGVNWQGGGNFIYCELLMHNQKFVEQIQNAQTTPNLAIIWAAMQQQAFLSYRINPKDIDTKGKDFEALTFEQQQRFLLALLDKNMLYVPYSEIDDTDWQVSELDKQLNKQFYGATN